jgi:hypothetical protein
MKKNLIIAVLAMAFTASFSWNWIVKAKGDSVAETVEAVNTYVGNGGTFSNISGSDGTLQITFTSPPNVPATILTVTVTNIDEEDISYVIN